MEKIGAEATVALGLTVKFHVTLREFPFVSVTATVTFQSPGFSGRIAGTGQVTLLELTLYPWSPVRLYAPTVTTTDPGMIFPSVSPNEAWMVGVGDGSSVPGEGLMGVIVIGLAAACAPPENASGISKSASSASVAATLRIAPTPLVRRRLRS